MKNKVLFLFLVVLTFFSTYSLAQQGSITVLLARTSGVSDGDAREMLVQINELADESGIESLGGFTAAEVSLGLPKVHLVSCTSTSGLVLVGCARDKLSAKRDAASADIVLLMVSQDIFNDCGSVDLAMINADTVSNLNQDLGYAVIEKQCFEESFNGQVTASHEVGHLLSIEHEDGDNDPRPLLAPGNHAQANLYFNSTAVASSGDCFPFNCDFHNFFSDKDKDFSATLFDGAGNAHSNAVNVVESLSWAVVAAYRTPAAPNKPSFSAQFISCHQPLCALWDFDFSSSGATQYRVERQSSSGGVWSPETLTPNTGFFPHLASNALNHRVRAENSGGNSDWAFSWTSGECDGGPGGGID